MQSGRQSVPGSGAERFQAPEGKRRGPWGSEGPAASLQAGRTSWALWPPKCPGLQWGALPCRCEAAHLPYRCWQDSCFFTWDNFLMKLRFVNTRPQRLICSPVHLPTPRQGSALSPSCPSLPCRTRRRECILRGLCLKCHCFPEVSPTQPTLPSMCICPLRTPRHWFLPFSPCSLRSLARL